MLKTLKLLGLENIMVRITHLTQIHIYPLINVHNFPAHMQQKKIEGHKVDICMMFIMNKPEGVKDPHSCACSDLYNIKI